MSVGLFYLPYIPNVCWLCHYVNSATVFVERHENFIKSTFRNRCEIVGANGKNMLSIPLQQGRDHHRLYKDVRIDYTERWASKHWQSIRSAYGRAPFFEHYAESINALYVQPTDFLFDFNQRALQAILKLLRIDEVYYLTKEYVNSPAAVVDLRLQMPTIDSTGYHQVFADRTGFAQNMCALDLLFNLGTQAKPYLYSIKAPFRTDNTYA